MRTRWKNENTIACCFCTLALGLASQKPVCSWPQRVTQAANAIDCVTTILLEMIEFKYIRRCTHVRYHWNVISVRYPQLDKYRLNYHLCKPTWENPFHCLLCVKKFSKIVHARVICTNTQVNTLSPLRSWMNFFVILKLILMIDDWRIYWKIALVWMSLDLIHESMLVHVTQC